MPLLPPWRRCGPLDLRRGRVAIDARRLDTSPAWFSWVGAAQALDTVSRDGAAERLAAAKRAADKVLQKEIDKAERRGEERIRERVQAIPDSKRYEYREGQKTVAVIEAAAVEEAIRLVEPRST